MGSRKELTLNAELLTELQTWKRTTQFSSNEDWIFASPSKLGRQPWCYDEVLRRFHKAGIAEGIGKLGTHSMRTHTVAGLTPWVRRLLCNKSSCVTPTSAQR